MKTRILLGLVVAGLLVVSGGISAACSGGGGKQDTLTIDEYIQRVLSVDQADESRAAPFRTQLDSFSSLADDAVVPADVLTAFQALLQEEGTFTAAVKELKPPAEAAAVHQEAIDALSADRDSLKQVIDQVSEATTVGELNQLFAADDVVKADARRTNACLALQQFASDKDITVDLTC
jgi:hypothetical protein